MSKKHIIKSTLVISTCTLASRILGYIRDVSLASLLGAGFSMDAFTMAFRLANLLRRLVAEGSMTAAFVPVFTAYQKEHTSRELWNFVGLFFNLLVLVLIGIVLIGIVFSPAIVKIMSPGFNAYPEKCFLTIELNRIMMPYLLFISLASLMMGILNAHNHFFMPALSPAFLNIAIIFAAYKIAPFFHEPSRGIAIGVLIGGVCQFLCQMPFVIKKGFRFTSQISFRHPAVIKMGLLLLPGILGISMTQINIFFASFVASFLQEGTVSYIYYSNRVMELVLGIFSISLSIVILPAMSQKAARKDFEALKSIFRFAFKLIFWITIPAIIGLILLRHEIISVLFQHGKFTAQDTAATAQMLLCFSGGLFFISCIQIIIPVFYSLQNTKIPVRCAVWTMIANIFFNAVFFYMLPGPGIALSSTASACVNVILLALLLKREIGSLGILSGWPFYMKVSIATVVMGVVIFYMRFRMGIYTQHSVQGILYFIGIIIASIVVYTGMMILLGLRDVQGIVRQILKRA